MTESTGNEEIAKDARQHNDSGSDLDSQQRSISYQLEAYGSVPPHDSKLLKILPDGFPLFEPTTLRDEEEKCAKKDEQSDAQALEETTKLLLNAERRVKRITGELDLLRHHVEKFFIVMDRDIREKQMAENPIFRNQATWNKSAFAKGEALRSIMNLREVFRLSAGDSTIEKQLNFVPSVKLLTNEQDWMSLAMSMVRRQHLCREWLETTENFVKEIRRSTQLQRRFLKLLKDIRNHWKVQKIPYASHVYEKGDDYPYRAEMRIELLTIPSSCWGYDRQRRWVLPQHVGVLHVPIGNTTPAPYSLWPPLPIVSPTAPATADVYFTTPKRKKRRKEEKVEDVVMDGVDDDDVPLGVQIRWIGDASHCIEIGRQLQVRIIPIAITPYEKCETVMTNSSCFGESMNDRKISCNTPLNNQLENNYVPSSYTMPSLLPLPGNTMDSDANWSPESLKLHKRLQIGQWRLVDRAIHLIWQAQAARLKDVLDVASFGSSEGSSYAASVLEEFESFRHELPITLKQQSSIHQSTNDNRRSNLPIFISRQITVDRWETYMSSLSIRNIPIYGPITESISESDLPVHKFKVDLEIWVTYLPASSELNEVVPSSTKFPSRSDLNPRLCSHSKGNPYLIEFLRRLPILESLSVCYLRHQFLQAWKTTINTVPHACFDVYPMTLPSTRNGAGALLFVDFVDWIQTFLSSQMLLKIPPFSVSPKVICDDKVAST